MLIKCKDGRGRFLYTVKREKGDTGRGGVFGAPRPGRVGESSKTTVVAVFKKVYLFENAP
jgi:hypothetical protein